MRSERVSGPYVRGPEKLHAIDPPPFRGLDHLIVKNMNRASPVADQHFLPKVTGDFAQFEKTQLIWSPNHRIAVLHHRTEVIRASKQGLNVGRSIGECAIKIISLKGLNLTLDR